MNWKASVPIIGLMAAGWMVTAALVVAFFANGVVQDAPEALGLALAPGLGVSIFGFGALDRGSASKEDDEQGPPSD